jgi:UPF0716 protein FxsA
MGKLLFLFIVVPAVELILLIKLGGLIGLFPTVAIIFFTGALGATLARWQGLSVIRQIQTQMAQGQLPANALFDGVIILLAGALLLTPGFLTDIVGFLSLVPGVRNMIKRGIQKRVEKSIQHGDAVVIGWKR